MIRFRMFDKNDNTPSLVNKLQENFQSITFYLKSMMAEVKGLEKRVNQIGTETSKLDKTNGTTRQPMNVKYIKFGDIGPSKAPRNSMFTHGNDLYFKNKDGSVRKIQ